MLAALLKTRQDLGYFPPPGEASTLTPFARIWRRSSGSNRLPICTPRVARREVALPLSRGRQIPSRRRPYDPDGGIEWSPASSLSAARTMSDPADLINRAIETLRAAVIDLPAFSTLDRLVEPASRAKSMGGSSNGGQPSDGRTERCWTRCWSSRPNGHHRLQSPQADARARDTQTVRLLDRTV